MQWLTKKQVLSCWLFLTSLMAGLVQAEQLFILSAGAVEPALVRVVQNFEKKTGHQVRIEYGTSPQLAKKLSDQQIADVLITPTSVMSEQIKQNRIVQENPISFGKVGAGITVRKQLSNPLVSSLDELKESLLKADSVVYNSASTGLYLEKLFEKIGIAEQLKPKTKRFANGDMVLTHIINGTGNEIGFGAIPEIKMYEAKGQEQGQGQGQGLKYVGPLPKDVQNYTGYVAAVMRASKRVDLANELLLFITDKSNLPIFQEAGIE